ncbi:hypothetical protein [Fuerstiella marisgermanici]|nr:hypothetical protein [Fuerstiella marisgermanici]
MRRSTAHILICLLTTVMVALQCIAPATAGCLCAGNSVESRAEASCCSETTTETEWCCETSKCTCGERCGEGNTDCECGCGERPQKPQPAQESESPAESHVKVLADVSLDESIVDVLNAAETTAMSRSHRTPSNPLNVQILLCTWQT